MLCTFLLGAALAAPHASAAIFSHADKHTGLVTISNVPPQGAPFAIKSVAATASAAAQFPRVSVARQQQLDQGRRTILLAELANEQKALSAALSAGAAGTDLRRHEANLAALQRELRASP